MHVAMKVSLSKIAVSASLIIASVSTLASIGFTPIQQSLFTEPGGQAVAWADFDLDGDLDLAVGFKQGQIRLYAQDQGTFTRVEAAVGLNMPVSDYRSLSWGDANNDGFPDLFVGYGRDSGYRSLLFIGGKKGFIERAAELKADALGTTRQSVWIDYDNDGDSDLFVAMRDRASKMYRNDGSHFTDVSKATKLNDPRRSVAAVWLDVDKDGDIDLFLPNQSGDRDGLYVQQNGKFTDVAATLNIDRPRRPLTEGSVGATLCDVNNDGNMDMFVPVYGKDMLYIADGKGGFTEQAAKWGVDAAEKAVSADCGDVNNDGLMDIYVVAYQDGVAHGSDRLYINQGEAFVDAFPKELSAFDGDHGVRFADYDNDGDLDLAITNRHKDARHSIWRNDLLSSKQTQYIKINVLDKNGNFTRQGDEVRVYAAGTKELLGFQVVDTGGGYVSQNMQPLHFGLGAHQKVDIEYTRLTSQGRTTTLSKDIAANQLIIINAD